MFEEFTTMSEQELREADAPWPKTMDELTGFITALTERDHNYGTCVYAMSFSAVAAMYYAAHLLGVTGFQAGCAELDFLQRTRNLEGPFMIVNVANMIYPQYNIVGDLQEYIAESMPRIRDMAREKIATTPSDNVHPDVWAHWQKLANGE